MRCCDVKRLEIKILKLNFLVMMFSRIDVMLLCNMVVSMNTKNVQVI